nr:tRNA 2-thiouridine(34) synthase MnmA [Candidatus Clavichlamydia salmonicola]
MNKRTVVVGMSGGVDSSVTAFLLKEAGYRVIGVFMKNWIENDENGNCHSVEDFDDVRHVCQHLDIPYYTVDFSQKYWDNVFSVCLEKFNQGLTPNPDVMCNREIKFKWLFFKAKELGADFLATGHYCRVGNKDGQSVLLKGKDPSKDQSYFLYDIDPKVLSSVLFPIGELHKTETRKIAEEAGLSTAKKKDSTGLCFVGKRDFREFLSRYISPEKGDIICVQTKKKLGTHNGFFLYTYGQRKGLGIGGPGDAWYVVGKDPERNEVYVIQGDGGNELFNIGLIASRINWLYKPALPCVCKAKIRYRVTEEVCHLTEMCDGTIQTIFNNPTKAITPGQAVVFYDGEVCLGGGTIDRVITQQEHLLG